MNRTATRRAKVLDTWGMGILVALVVEFLFGTYASLFVEMPDGAEAWAFAAGDPFIATHMILSVLLIAAGGFVLGLAIKTQKSEWMLCSAIGLAGILAAVTFGAFYVSSGQETLSFLMAVSMGISLLAYSTGIYLSSLSRRS